MAAASPLRLALGFLIAPLVVPLCFVAYEALAGGGIRSGSQIVGIFVTYGAYAYIFAVLLGAPVLWVLIRGSRTDALTMAIAGAGVAFLGAAIFYAIGLRSGLAIVIAIVGGAAAGLVFRSIAGLHGRADM